ncbi:hypothetical protein L596_021521 [Steinernema carpocapsae]|uniref:Uncharacterized protein n=1 Tax=Steinernema carpocapsae TaxID=34508 RepID=A0A4U5MJ11_STECR|nr:hypothetical protein L596_021521 [Steinernema carpocapsae]
MTGSVLTRALKGQLTKTINKANEARLTVRMVYEQLSMLRWCVETANQNWVSMAEAYDALNNDDNDKQIVEEWQRDLRTYVPNQEQPEDPKEVPLEKSHWDKQVDNRQAVLANRMEEIGRLIQNMEKKEVETTVEVEMPKQGDQEDPQGPPAKKACNQVLTDQEKLKELLKKPEKPINWADEIQVDERPRLPDDENKTSPTSAEESNKPETLEEEIMRTKRKIKQLEEIQTEEEKRNIQLKEGLRKKKRNTKECGTHSNVCTFCSDGNRRLLNDATNHYTSLCTAFASADARWRWMVTHKRFCDRCLKPPIGCRHQPRPCSYCGNLTHHAALCRETIDTLQTQQIYRIEDLRREIAEETMRLDEQLEDLEKQKRGAR